MKPPPPELLAPAGNWECARAAVANGADAIYFGLPDFNARLRADNFTGADLPELMSFLHQHGVKGYTAFNTLIFTGEIPRAIERLRELEAAGVDAVIIQDLGLASIVKEVAPRLRLHASTQMTITSPEGLAFAARLGIDQAVLARELSLRELERFRAAGQPDLPLEVFVHGALCVAYSGQCLTSESLGRRSANRGECAQACRMPYEMVVDGETVDLGDKRYLLSPQDLAAVDEIPRLIQLGIRSFKIEGRLKSPEYVAAVTSVYRRAIDRALEQGGVADPVPAPADDRYALEMTFSRGLFSGWMHGVNHQQLVGARFGKKRGPLLGAVARTARDAVELDSLLVDLAPGDGVVFENPADTNSEQGGRVYAVRDRRLEFEHGRLDLSRITAGTRVFKTDDPRLNKRLRQTYQGAIPVRKQWRLAMTATGAEGQPLRLSATAVHLRGNASHSAAVSSSTPLQAAQKHPLSEDVLRQHLGKLGDTPFTLGGIESQLEGGLILPVSELNQMRRELVSQLNGSIQATQPAAAASATAGSDTDPATPLTDPGPHVLLALCRTPEQIEAALAVGLPRVYLDFEDIRRYADAVSAIRDADPDVEIFLATPRIQKSGEAGFFKLIERASPDGVLIRNLGALAFFDQSPLRLTGDFSLNVANHLSAALLKRLTLLEHLTLSYDLNLEQITALLAASRPAWFEITLHQHMPMFHMEHCAFAAFLSEGTDFTNCGRPCEKHRVALRDRVGVEHPLKADVGCRNTLFNASAQTGAPYFETLRDAGLRRFRVELLDEDRRRAEEILRAYLELLSGHNDGAATWRRLRATPRLGVTKGTLE
jgi:putative protease